jgi:hypothetical protein
MFSMIVSQLIQNADFFQNSKKCHCLDMFGVHTFQILEQIYVTTEQIQDIFWDLRNWEIQKVLFFFVGMVFFLGFIY